MNGNIAVIGHRLIFLRLLTTNAVEIVHYDVLSVKEIERPKHLNDNLKVD